MYAIFFNSSGPVVQVSCPSGHIVTGRFYKNSVLKKVKEFYKKETTKKKRPCTAKRIISSKKMLYAIFFNSSKPVVQVSCPSGHIVTGRFYKNSVLKIVKEFYNKKRPSRGWSGVHLLHDNASSHKCEVVKSFFGF